MTRFIRTASVIVALGGLGVFLSSSCGSDPPATVADNNTGGSAGGGADSDGATAMGGSAGSSAATDASAGSASIDMDATIFVDAMLEIPDGAFATGDASLDDDAGDPIIEDDAGPVMTQDGGSVLTKNVLCGTLDGGASKACRLPSSHCCYDSDTGAGSCASPELKCANGVYNCDGPGDCAAGEVCCATVSTLAQPVGSPNHEYSTRCATSCGTGAIAVNTAYAVACTKSAECDVGKICRPVANMPKGMGACVIGIKK